MKRAMVLMALLGLMTAGMSGCILSATPNPGKTVCLSAGESQTFAVKAFLNKGFVWYKDGVVLGETGASYVFTATPEDAGKLITIQVEATDMFNKTDVKAWKVALTSPPVANAGSDVDTVVGAVVQLDGSLSSDPDNDPLTYQWSVVSRPEGSANTISDPTLVNPTFKPDVEGEYVIQLVVNDGLVDSAPDTLTLKVVKYTQGFEAGISAPWSVSVTPASFPYVLTDKHVYSGAYAFQPGPSPAENTNDNQVVLSLTMPQKPYVYSISAWMYRVGTSGDATSAIHSELRVDDVLMLNGNPAPRAPHELIPANYKYHILDPNANDTWVQRTWVVNAQVSKIDFVYNDLWNILDKVYLDDIVINTWGD